MNAEHFNKMSSEQTVVDTAPAENVDVTQQATISPPARQKNPKRVEAGKRVAERTRLAREQQKKALAEAEVIIANKKRVIANKDVIDSYHSELKEEKSVLSGGLSISQWIGLGGLVVSAAGLFLKREEIAAAVKKNLPSPPPPPEPAPSPPVEPETPPKLFRKVR